MLRSSALSRSTSVLLLTVPPQIKASRDYKRSVVRDTLFHVDMAFNELSLGDILPLLRLLNSYSLCSVAMQYALGSLCAARMHQAGSDRLVAHSFGYNNFSWEELMELLEDYFPDAGLGQALARLPPAGGFQALTTHAWILLLSAACKFPHEQAALPHELCRNLGTHAQVDQTGQAHAGILGLPAHRRAGRSPGGGGAQVRAPVCRHQRFPPHGSVHQGMPHPPHGQACPGPIA